MQVINYKDWINLSKCVFIKEQQFEGGQKQVECGARHSINRQKILELLGITDILSKAPKILPEA
jgi:hypothetical protein